MTLAAPVWLTDGIMFCSQKAQESMVNNVCYMHCAMQPGAHRRAWCAVNDHCSEQGPVWTMLNSHFESLSNGRNVLHAMQPGVHRRAWCAVNDHCSEGGPVWRTKHCILMEPVMQVSSRGTNLEQSFDRELAHVAAEPTLPSGVQVHLGGVDWLHFTGVF